MRIAGELCRTPLAAAWTTSTASAASCWCRSSGWCRPGTAIQTAEGGRSREPHGHRRSPAATSASTPAGRTCGSRDTSSNSWTWSTLRAQHRPATAAASSTASRTLRRCFAPTGSGLTPADSWSVGHEAVQTFSPPFHPQSAKSLMLTGSGLQAEPAQKRRN